MTCRYGRGTRSGRVREKMEKDRSDRRRRALSRLEQMKPPRNAPTVWGFEGELPIPEGLPSDVVNVLEDLRSAFNRHSRPSVRSWFYFVTWVAIGPETKGASAQVGKLFGRTHQWASHMISLARCQAKYQRGRYS